MDKPWWLYMIECQSGGIYTGIAVDVALRYTRHVEGKGAKYTRMNPPLRLLAKKQYPDRSSATKAECAIKRLTAAEKRSWALREGAHGLD
jgi:putative endonuclease